MQNLFKYWHVPIPFALVMLIIMVFMLLSQLFLVTDGFFEYGNTD